jgi:tetratricopeptide (TPR) repeat protein
MVPPPDDPTADDGRADAGGGARGPRAETPSVAPSDPDLAIKHLRAADAIAALDAQGLADLVGHLAQAGRDQEASIYAARLLALRPAHRRALRALVRWPMADIDVAAGWRSVAASAPEDPEPWLQIARLAARAKDSRGAIEACDKVLTRSAGHGEALTIKIAQLQSQGELEDVAELWTQLNAADPKRARTVLTKATEGADTDAVAILLGAGGAAGALETELGRLRTSLRIKLVAGAYEAEVASDHEAAARAFWRLTKLEPGESDYADGLRRALGHLRAGIERADPEPAPSVAASARMLIRFDPTFRAAHVVLGRAMAAAKRWAEAETAFARALALEDEDSSVRLEHAATAAHAGSIVEALGSWRRALALGADAQERGPAQSTRELIARSARKALNAAIDADDWARAWAAHETLAEVEDDAEGAQTRRASLLKETGRCIREAANERRPETSELCRLFLDAEPGDPRVTLILARALLRERRYLEALPLWEALGAANRSDFEPPLQVARIAKRLDDRRLGAEACARLMSLAPDHEEGGALTRHFDETAPLG